MNLARVRRIENMDVLVSDCRVKVRHGALDLKPRPSKAHVPEGGGIAQVPGTEGVHLERLPEPQNIPRI